MSVPKIGRYPPGLDLLGFQDPPTGVTPETVMLIAQDGARTKGVLYATPKDKTVICILHPRGDMTRHYLIPAVVNAGYAVFGHESRWPGNNSTASHEVLLLDIAAAVTAVRDRGFEQVVLLGCSGGGSVYALYQSQAMTAPPNRLTDTAAGDPFDLNKVAMPAADAIIFAAAHLGAGKTMLQELDPSVTDEDDPRSCDPRLDMYNPVNGFAPAPAPSKYSDEFLTPYRAAQSARVTRIDAIARQHIAEQRTFQALAAAPEFGRMSNQDKTFIQRRAILGTYMRVYRTDANPGAVDPSISPSLRSYGSLMAIRPDLGNYTENGFAKALTPRAWLSLWSGHSSRASLLDSLPNVTAPTLVVCYTGDNAIYPSSAEAIYNQSPADEKSIAYVDGDHFGFPLASNPDRGGREEAGKVVTAWLKAHFPGR